MLLTTVMFDSKNFFWKSDRRYNICFLRCIEDYLNDILKHKGYVYLNEICEQVGAGWNPDTENLCIKKDSDYRRIDFAIYDGPNDSLIVHIMAP